MKFTQGIISFNSEISNRPIYMIYKHNGGHNVAFYYEVIPNNTKYLIRHEYRVVLANCPTTYKQILIHERDLNQYEAILFESDDVVYFDHGRINVCNNILTKFTDNFDKLYSQNLIYFIEDHNGE